MSPTADASSVGGGGCLVAGSSQNAAGRRGNLIGKKGQKGVYTFRRCWWMCVCLGVCVYVYVRVCVCVVGICLCLRRSTRCRHALWDWLIQVALMSDSAFLFCSIYQLHIMLFRWWAITTVVRMFLGASQSSSVWMVSVAISCAPLYCIVIAAEQKQRQYVRKDSVFKRIASITSN